MNPLIVNKSMYSNEFGKCQQPIFHPSLSYTNLSVSSSSYTSLSMDSGKL